MVIERIKGDDVVSTALRTGEGSVMWVSSFPAGRAEVGGTASLVRLPRWLSSKESTCQAGGMD